MRRSSRPNLKNQIVSRDNEETDESLVPSRLVAEQQSLIRILQAQVELLNQNQNRGFEIISSVSASLGIRSGK
jgi:hypothetical protein